MDGDIDATKTAAENEDTLFRHDPLRRSPPGILTRRERKFFQGGAHRRLFRFRLARGRALCYTSGT